MITCRPTEQVCSQHTYLHSLQDIHLCLGMDDVFLAADYGGLKEQNIAEEGRYSFGWPRHSINFIVINHGKVVNGR